MTKKKDIIIPTATINYSQYDPKNLINWGEYKEVGDEMKILELHMKHGFIPYLIEGDKGIGKTLMIHTLCRNLQYPLVEYSCSSGTDEGNLLGRLQINDDGSFFELGILPTAFEVANHFGVCVLYMDEINALLHEVMKILNRPFDDRRSVIANNTIYKLNKGCRLIIIGTMNPSSYSGVNTLTEDLRSRMIGTIMHYPTTKQLETIIDWTDIDVDSIKKPMLTYAQETHALRVKGDVDYAISPRDIDQFCKHYRMLAKSFESNNALTYGLKQTMLCKFSDIEERELIKTRLEDIFGVKL